MTVIAWDGKTLAADKRATFEGFGATTTKIRRLASGTLLATTGHAGIGRALTEWYEDGCLSEYPDKESECTLLVITSDGHLAMYEKSRSPIILENKFIAMGSGRDYALAAMHLGKNAAEAVAVACIFDIACGNGIDTLAL